MRLHFPFMVSFPFRFFHFVWASSSSSFQERLVPQYSSVSSYIFHPAIILIRLSIKNWDLQRGISESPPPSVAAEWKLTCRGEREKGFRLRNHIIIGLNDTFSQNTHYWLWIPFIVKSNSISHRCKHQISLDWLCHFCCSTQHLALVYFLNVDIITRVPLIYLL